MREFRSFFAAFLALVAVESFVVQHRTRQTESLEAIRVRNWQESDPVLNVLEAYSKSSRFDPEGPLTTDCSSALQESRIPTARTTVVAFSALSMKVLWEQL